MTPAPEALDALVAELRAMRRGVLAYTDGVLDQLADTLDVKAADAIEALRSQVEAPIAEVAMTAITEAAVEAADYWKPEHLLAFLDALAGDMEAGRPISGMRLFWQVTGHASQLRAHLAAAPLPKLYTGPARDGIEAMRGLNDIWPGDKL